MFLFSVNFEQIKKHEASQQSEAAGGGGGTRKPVRRQNSRRHTLSSGIDYNVVCCSNGVLL